MALRYRADIDGLRAVAVVAVILYHFKVPGFAGGFFGVDVFFVISGFLITSLISRELEEQQFSLIHFYERRVRRIVPALVVVLFAVSIIAFWELFPLAYKRFGRSVAATSVFLSNVEFWLEADYYFGVSAHERPLLHTWSLAVEEQFYLLFPPLLMLLARRPKRWTIVVVALLAAGSFGFAAWSSFTDPLNGFYLFPSRIWELLLGALIALGALPIASSQRVNNTLAALGMGMIVYAIAAYAIVPGINVLLACAGAALVILAGLKDDPLVNRLLSTRYLVFIGLISYSLYLWHWPLYVFATYHVGGDLTPFESVCFIAASFAIAAVSWRFVEQPFRRPGGVVPRRQLFLQTAAVMSVLGVSGVAIHLANGMPQRFTPDVQTALAPQTNRPWFSCDPGQGEETALEWMCSTGRSGAPVTYMVWGDSHALSLWPGIAHAADRSGHSGMLSAMGGCLPFVEPKYPLTDLCRRHNEATLALLRTQKIRDVILIGRWPAYTESSRYTLDRELRDATPISKAVSLEDTHRDFGLAVDDILYKLRAMGLRAIIVAPIPEIGVDVPTTLARRRMRGLSDDFGPTRAAFEARNKTMLDRLASMDGRVQRAYPHLVLCDGPTCAVTRERKPLYFDDNHLTPLGADLVGTIFEPIFADHQ
jgi:peptidoglycan/LPS O-acetylase OafA/YrhL